MSYIKLENISKKYDGSKEFCIENLNLLIEKGEIVAMLGESGCGKTTLLKIVAGLEQQNQGNVFIDGEDMKSKLAEHRPIAMVFQKALLFPHMTIEKNVNFAPRVNKTMDKKTLKERTKEMLQLVHMEGFENRKPTEISGGQEQRISLARALITNPKVLLLDEPLSALDANLKTTMVSTIREINRKLNTTMIYVTHDQTEAAAVADKIALMHKGQIVQYDKPEMFYKQPANKYVAEFFGWKNFIPAVKRGKEITSSFGIFFNQNEELKDGDVMLCIRPEAIRTSAIGKYTGTVLEVMVQGVDVQCTLKCGEELLVAKIRTDRIPEKGEVIRFEVDEKMVWVV